MDVYIFRILVLKVLAGLIVHVGLSSSNNISINVNDEIISLYFNGIQVRNSDLPKAYDYQIADRISLPEDTKVIAVHGQNIDYVASLLASDSDGKVFTEKLWKYNTVGEPGWMNENFDDSHWKTVTAIALNDPLTSDYYVSLISRHAAFVWSPGWDADGASPENDVYFRYTIQENVQRRYFDLMKPGMMVNGIGNSCTQGSRLRCAARCGQMPMSVCAAFQRDTVSGLCCFINGSMATKYFVSNLVPGANWRIYSAVDYNDPCC